MLRTGRNIPSPLYQPATSFARLTTSLESLWQHRYCVSWVVSPKLLVSNVSLHLLNRQVGTILLHNNTHTIQYLGINMFKTQIKTRLITRKWLSFNLYSPRYLTQPQSINFMTPLWLGLGYRALVFASKTNLNLGPQFAKVWWRNIPFYRISQSENVFAKKFAENISANGHFLTSYLWKLDP